MSIYYKQAIDLVGDIGSIDLRSVAIDYAKRHPAEFCRVAGISMGYKSECKRLLEGGQKIDAIKLWRNETGDGLKEAKEAVESL